MPYALEICAGDDWADGLELVSGGVYVENSIVRGWRLMG